MASNSVPQRLTRDMIRQHKSLDAAFACPPKPCDSERQRSFFPCLQCQQVPQGWPTNPPVSQIIDSKFYAGLGSEALFFMFYFQEGSLAQMLAAKALKSKSWRFHKTMKIWIQRIEPPKVTTTTFERGNYRYWDVASWSEKQKPDFVFEYCQLENAELSGGHIRSMMD